MPAMISRQQEAVSLHLPDPRDALALAHDLCDLAPASLQPPPVGGLPDGEVGCLDVPAVGEAAEVAGHVKLWSRQAR